MQQALSKNDHSLAKEIAACGQIVKGYGDTHRRAMRHFNFIAGTYFSAEDDSVINGNLADAVHRARVAALSDPEGETLDSQIATDTGKINPMALGRQNGAPRDTKSTPNQHAAE